MMLLWRHIADTNDILPPVEVTGSFLLCGVNANRSHCTRIGEVRRLVVAWEGKPSNPPRN
jgi:hypothetical protein